MRAFSGAWVWVLPTLAAAAIIPPRAPVHRDHVEQAETNRAVLKLGAHSAFISHDPSSG